MDITIFIGNLFEQCIWIFYILKILDAKYSKTTVIVSILATTIIYTCILEPVREIMLIRAITVFIINFVLIYILFNNKLFEKLICIMLFLVSVIISELTMLSIAKYLFKIEFLYTSGFSIKKILLQYGTYILLGLLTNIISHFWKIRKLDFNEKNSSYISFYILSQILILYILCAIFYKYKITSILIFGFIIMVIICSAVLIIWMYKNSIREFENQKNMQIEKEQLKLTYKHFNEIKEQYNEFKKVRHDFENHVSAINRLIQNVKYEMAEDYIFELKKELDKANNITFCANPIVDSVIFNKFNIAKSIDIKFESNIIEPKELKISDIDLCSLFSNLLDNAIEGARKYSGKKHIWLETAVKSDNFVITVKNSATDVENLKTTKDDKSNHGLGVGIIKNIAAKYSGNAAFKYFQSEFVAVVYLKM